MRPWRYMAVINDGVVEQWWQEPVIGNEGEDDDPTSKLHPENVLAYLKSCKYNMHPTDTYPIANTSNFSKS